MSFPLFRKVHVNTGIKKTSKMERVKISLSLRSICKSLVPREVVFGVVVDIEEVERSKRLFGHWGWAH
jgi:hypothetical protein